MVTAGSGAGRRARYAAAALAGRPRLDRLAGAPPDVVWLPEPAPVAVSHGVPFVLTLHDLSFDAGCRTSRATNGSGSVSPGPGRSPAARRWS